MNINVRNILTVFAVCNHSFNALSTAGSCWCVAKSKAASFPRNWTHCFPRLVRWLVQMAGRERVLADHEGAIVGGPGGSLSAGEGVKSL